MDVINLRYDVPNGAERCFKPPQRLNTKDKYSRGVGLNFQENSEFTGICSLGPEQLVGCYGNTFCDDGYSRNDFMFMCKDCPYFLGLKNISHRDVCISEPYFIEKEYSNLLDYRNDNPAYFVYFVSDGEYIKIGISNNMKSRLSQLQTGNPKKLEVLCLIPVKNEISAKKLEQKLHIVYQRFSVCGEWFDILRFLRLDDFRIYYDAKYYDDVTGLVNSRPA